ncbi:MAG: hypothetical protein DLM72_16660 [Candidatus Nitrosopolaris wilkensis]|nr:MAG: hypothetical protein DLM72_16660 [Candidatus Nitrosopolaris wilkensis]
MAELTSIQLTKETREKLSSLGRHRESYEDIILRLIEVYDRVKPSSEIGVEEKEKMIKGFSSDVHKQTEKMKSRKK